MCLCLYTLNVRIRMYVCMYHVHCNVSLPSQLQPARQLLVQHQGSHSLAADEAEHVLLLVRVDEWREETGEEQKEDKGLYIHSCIHTYLRTYMTQDDTALRKLLFT